MIVKIDKLSHDLRGICRVDDKVTFVGGTLPSEIVDIVVTKQKKKNNEACLKKIIDKSIYRVEPKCKYASICGGCDISYIEYKRALQYKKEAFIDIMHKYAQMDVNPEIVSNNIDYGYRNKISLKVFQGKLSLMMEKSNSYVLIDNCYLVNDNIARVIESLNKCNLSGISEIVIRGNDEIMVIIKGNILDDEIIRNLSNCTASVILNDKVIYGKEYIIIRVNNFDYALYPNSFFQVNTEMMIKLYDKILEDAGYGDKLYDLYCGAGTIGIYLAKNFKEVVGIEVNDDAIRGANLNKKLNKVDNVSFIKGKANNIKLSEKSTIVVDPPRSGLDKKVIDKIISSNVKKIIYVSCNPITLARDIKILMQYYELTDVTLFDMFPNTKHIESVCLLELK